MLERIQKIIANAGYCSRRDAEELILEGQVRVNGRIATIGQSADKMNDTIIVEGKKIEQRKVRRVYFALFKPRGVETTLESNNPRTIVTDLIKCRERVIPAGRLDMDSRGLLILTNDGEMANRIMHPSYPIDKVYRVKIRGEVPTYLLERMSNGVMLVDGITRPCKVTLIKRSSDTTLISMTLHEGRKRQIRRMVEAVGFTVLDLLRTRIGEITLRGLREGQSRELKKSELKSLRKTLGMC
jgi:23S rRNA pseudouridine2605 synthase